MGLGSIGGFVAKKFYYGFGMEVVGVKRNVNKVDPEIRKCVQDVITMD